MTSMTSFCCGASWEILLVAGGHVSSKHNYRARGDSEQFRDLSPGTVVSKGEPTRWYSEKTVLGFLLLCFYHPHLTYLCVLRML